MGQAYASFERNNFFNSYSFMREVQDPNFGPLYVFENDTTHQPVFVQEIEFDVLSASDANKYRERFSIQHKYILDIYNVFESTGAEFYDKVQDHDHFDPNERILLMVFEYYESDLSKEIETKIS